MQSPAEDDTPSYFAPQGYQYSSCGYCKSRSGNSTSRKGRRDYWAESDAVQAEHYQLLVDRGWRRSGTHYYKPDPRYSCCPHYTIRLDAPSFKSSKDQRKAVNRWNRYVLGPEYIRKAARLCPKTREEKRLRRDQFDLSKAVHEAEYALLQRPIDPTTQKPLEPDHRFVVTLESDGFTEEKFALFSDYQKHVHHEPQSKISTYGFKSFLCSGLKPSTRRIDGKAQALGSYHQCYRLDGRLVAMAVLDLLPQCVSAVYFVYHQDMSHWNFGKISALRETALAMEGGYRYYYMGYYIHSCVKMRYKGGYSPQYLLDPETYTWDLLDDDLRRRLDVRNYVSLSRERRLGLAASGSSCLQSNVKTTSAFDTELNMGLRNFRDDLDYTEGNVSQSNTNPWECSLFDLYPAMPGVMAKEEVEQDIDLGNWKLELQGNRYPLKRLVGWDKTSITDLSTTKGYFAEFAACIGPELVDKIVLREV